MVNIAGFEYVCKQCAVCGCIHYMPQVIENECVKKGPKKSWFCPNGHERIYCETSEDVIRRERDLLQQRIAQKDDELASVKRVVQQQKQEVSAYKGQVTRIKKRISGGACPCCNRNFGDLQRHMTTKHPEYSITEH